MFKGNASAVFLGHDSGFDVFSLKVPIICPWCSTVNEALEMPCSDPITLDLNQNSKKIEK